jgi:hypothetical protein
MGSKFVIKGPTRYWRGSVWTGMVEEIIRALRSTSQLPANEVISFSLRYFVNQISSNES